MFMSKVLLDQDNIEKISDLTHLGAYHNWVESSFPEEYTKHPNRRLRHLWRMDEDSAGRKYLLVVSQNYPDITGLEKYGIKGSAQVKEYDDFLSSIDNGDSMQFRLVTNPRYKSRGHKRVERVAKDQINWLLKRSEKNGFEIYKDPKKHGKPVVSVNKQEWLPYFHDIKGEIHKMDLLLVTFDGILIVKNAEKFRKMLTTGLGSEKAYGSGLMTVASIAIY